MQCKSSWLLARICAQHALKRFRLVNRACHKTTAVEGGPIKTEENACLPSAFSPGSSLPTSRHGLDALTCSGFGRPLVARGRVGVGSLRAGPEGDGDEKSKAAAEEAAKWKEMASKMADQRKEVKDGPSPVKDVEVSHKTWFHSIASHSLAVSATCRWLAASLVIGPCN